MKRSTQICNDIMDSLIRIQENKLIPVQSFKRMVVGQIVQLKGKIGKILAFAWVRGYMCVWLEIPLTRGKAVHCGVRL